MQQPSCAREKTTHARAHIYTFTTHTTTHTNSDAPHDHRRGARASLIENYANFILFFQTAPETVEPKNFKVGKINVF